MTLTTPNGLTFAKRACARCDEENVPLVFTSDGRLVCRVCLPITERHTAAMRGEAIRRADRRRSLAASN